MFTQLLFVFRGIDTLFKKTVSSLYRKHEYHILYSEELRGTPIRFVLVVFLLIYGIVRNPYQYWSTC